MRIKQVSIQNVRACRSIDMPLDTVTYLTGMNGAGKSTILESIKLALFGRNAWTDGRGTGSARQIADGAKKGVIGVFLDNDLVVECELAGTKKTWTITDRATGEVCYERPADMWAALGIPSTLAELCCTRLDSPEFSAVMGDYLSEEIKRESVDAMAGAHLEWWRDWVAKHVLSPKSVDDWRQVGEAAYEERTGINAELKTLRADLESMAYCPAHVDKRGNLLTVTDIPQIKAVVERLDAQLRDLDREYGGASKSADGKSRGEIETAIAQLELFRANIAKEIEDLNTKRGGMESQAREVANRISAARIKLSAANNDLQRAMQARDVIASGTCPTCGQPVGDNARAAADWNVAEAQRVKAKIEPQIAQDESSEQSIRDRIIEASQNIAKRQAELGKIASDIADNRAQLAVSSRRTLAEIQDEIDTVTASRNRAIEALGSLNLVRQKHGLTERIAELETRAAGLTWAADGFKKGEILNQLCDGTRKAKLIETANAKLRQYGYEMDLMEEGKAWTVRLRRKGNWRLLRDCSQGEQIMAEFCFVAALAHDNKLPVLVDDVDGLDGERKNTLRGMLRQAVSQESTLLVSGAWGQSTKPEPEQINAAFAPATVWWVADGTTKRM